MSGEKFFVILRPHFCGSRLPSAVRRMSFYGRTFPSVGILADMLLTDVSTNELRRLIRAGERSSDPDEYALAVLRRELKRRQASDRPDAKQVEEAPPCGK
jgi:hypothetical protein